MDDFKWILLLSFPRIVCIHLLQATFSKFIVQLWFKMDALSDENDNSGTWRNCMRHQNQTLITPASVLIRSQFGVILISTGFLKNEQRTKQFSNCPLKGKRIKT